MLLLRHQHGNALRIRHIDPAIRIHRNGFGVGVLRAQGNHRAVGPSAVGDFLTASLFGSATNTLPLASTAMPSG